MFVVDTNILIYAADADNPEYRLCRSLLEEWRGQTTSWYLTWGIVYEFLRVVTHPRVFNKPWQTAKAWKFVNALLESSSLGILTETDRHAPVAEQVFSQVPAISGNLVFDAHTAILMTEHGIRRIYTRDMDFHRFPFLEVVDPVTESDTLPG